MNESVDIEMIRGLYASDEIARFFFDQWAERQKNSWTSTVDHLLHVARIEGTPFGRGEVVRFLKSLQEAGCGTFRAGRRGAKSRIEWGVSLISVGRAASGEDLEVEAVPEDTPETEEADAPLLRHEFQLRPEMRISVELPTNLTAEEARRLAAFIGTVPFS